MECVVEDCTNPYPQFVKIILYNNGVKQDEEIVCHHHFLMRNLSMFLALERANPKLYNQMKNSAKRFAERISDEKINSMFSVQEITPTVH